MPAAMPPPVHAPAPILASTFDLRRVRPVPKPACSGGPDEIVVCARADAGRYRAPQTDEARYAERVPRAEIGLVGDLKGGVRVEQQEIGAGQVSQRVLVGIKLPF